MDRSVEKWFQDFDLRLLLVPILMGILALMVAGVTVFID